MRDPLEGFHPATRRWFGGRFGAPTDVQRRVWPALRAGAHVLATAPTGSGKTLAAFLGVLDRFLTGALAGGATRVVYVSPLKALNNDVRVNLREPLGGLARTFADEGLDVAPVRVGVRSGDTSAGERRRLLQEPPEILITTPESLHVLITQERALAALATVETVIVDEIHALCANPRGLLLLSALERLVPEAGEFRRVGLSATVRPLERIAAWLGGQEETPGGRRPRTVRCVEGRDRKTVALQVGPILFGAGDAGAEGGDPLRPLAAELHRRISSRGPVLVFVNSRRMCERLAWLVNEQAGGTLVHAHHGSLDKALRADVEGRLRGGELAGLIATSSLELGIDVGELEEVVLVESPPSVAATLQRIGRAGHDLLRVSRAVLYPIHPRDALTAAALVRAVADRDVEPLEPAAGSLDVLAQLIVAWTAPRPWHLDDLYGALRRMAPYDALERNDFDAVVDLLAGRFEATRIRELAPQIDLDRQAGTLRARRGAVLALYRSGGVIPDRGYFELRLADGDVRIGELDEEFVFEARPGQVFALGARNWRIRAFTPRSVLVEPATGATQAPPFWRADELLGGSHLNAHVLAVLDTAEARLAAAGAAACALTLAQDFALDPDLARELSNLLARQRAETGAPLPHGTHVLVECVRSAAGPSGHGHGHQLLLHAQRGGRVHRALALLLADVLEHRTGAPVEVFDDDATVACVLPEAVDVDAVMADLAGTTDRAALRERLARRLLASNRFGLRFREAAGRALLLRKARFEERLPLWLSRLKAEQLRRRTERLGDFPVQRAALAAAFADLDLPGLEVLLAGLRDGTIAWSRYEGATPSPLGRFLAWDQIRDFMYRDDTPRGGREPDPETLRALIREGTVRRSIDPAVVAAWERRRRRLDPASLPRDEASLSDWLFERVVVDPGTWARLEEGFGGTGAGDPEALLGPRLVTVPGPGGPWRVHADRHRDLGTGLLAGAGAQGHGAGGSGEAPDLGTDAGDVAEGPLRRQLLEWLEDRGPAPVHALAVALPLDEDRLGRLLDALVDAGEVVRGDLLRGVHGPHYAHAAVYEALLRLVTRGPGAPRERLDPAAYQLALAALHTRATGAGGPVAADPVGRLNFWPMPPERIERSLRTAATRGPVPDPDALLRGGAHALRGVGRGRVCLVPTEDLDLLPPPPTLPAVLRPGLPDPGAWYGFAEVCERLGAEPSELAPVWWRAFLAGALAPDGWPAVAAGIRHRFRWPTRDGGRAPPPLRTRSAGRRAAVRRLQHGIALRLEAVPGLWRRCDRDAMPREAPDPLLAHERDAARVRVLLDRYGVVFRECLEGELPGFRWRDLAQALRRLELAGEVEAGPFVLGPRGPQYGTAEGFAALERAAGTTAPLALSATDPGSLAGRGLPLELPARRDGHWLLFAGGALVGTLAGDDLRGRDADRALEALAVVAAGTGTVIRCRDGVPLDRSTAQALTGNAPSWREERDHRGTRLRLTAPGA